jgi:hypothetical protein
MSEDQKAIVSRVQFFLKVVELSLSIVCMGLIVDPMKQKLQLNIHHIGLVHVAYAGFILINTIVIIGQTRAERMPQFMVGTATIPELCIRQSEILKCVLTID